MPYFRCIQEAVNRTFVIELLDLALVKHARAIVAGRITKGTSVEGDIIKELRPYNKPWSWHLDPATINFFERATEVCDASIVYVEEHLDEVGGAFLPRSHWCPWGSRLIEEVAFDRDAGMVTLPLVYEQAEP
jgi:hypothetical protein